MDLSLLVAAGPALTDKRIVDLGSLLSLALALIAIFTAQRWLAYRDRRIVAGLRDRQVFGGFGLDLGLFGATVLLWLVSLPLALDAWRNRQVLNSAGVLRTAFLIVWALLAALAVWQATIAGRTIRQRRK